jgi:2-oxoglutarate decarboxylase
MRAVPVMNSRSCRPIPTTPSPRRQSSTTSTSVSAWPSTTRSRRQSHPPGPGDQRRHPGLPGFWAAYEDLIRKVRTNKIGADDLAGATVSLTNPGTIGTVQSVPRLMPGQGAIVGVGAIDYPAEWQAADPRVLAELGVSKVVTITSTYDHRIIQGAESGLFLQKRPPAAHRRGLFLRAGVQGHGRPVRAGALPPRRQRPADGSSVHTRKQIEVDTLINMYRVRGHLIAHLDPLDWSDPHMHRRARPGHATGSDGVGPRAGVPDQRPGRIGAHTPGRHPGVLRDAYCRTVGVEYMHIQEPGQKRWIQEHTEGVSIQINPEEHRWILAASTRPRRSSSSSTPSTSARSASASRAASRPSPCSTPSSTTPRWPDRPRP